MLTLDFLVFFVMVAQPMCLGSLLFAIARQRLLSGLGWGARNLGPRLRLRGTRFFECAAYPRLQGVVRYQTQALALCGVFLIYDLDLLFFFPELARLGVWSTWQVCLFVI
jgi:hypothetical protein